MHVLDDYRIRDGLRYEGHHLIWQRGEEEPLMMGGMFGAAFLSAYLVDTEEGDARGLALDTDAQMEDFFMRYEREVRRDDWGYLQAEVLQLSDAYVQINVSGLTLQDLCPNIRLLNLAMEIVVRYMRHLVIELFGAHIWEGHPWTMPFAQWLLDAAKIETRRQRFLKTDWTDAALVTGLAEMPDEGETLTLRFEGENAVDIMERYLAWLSDEVVAMKQELPGAKISSADRKMIYTQECDWTFLQPEIAAYDKTTQLTWQRWMKEWDDFLYQRLEPNKQIRFWVNDVPEEVQEHLLYHLQLCEQHKAHYRDLTTAVYAMRQLGYIRRKCSVGEMMRWLSEHLKTDYTAKNNASQFRRAMNEHGRYSPEVQDEVVYLESIGYHKFMPNSIPEEE